MASAEEIAVELGKWRQNALLNFPRGNPLVNAVLIQMGLLDYRRRWWLWGDRRLVLTRKGRAVQRILEQRQ